MTEVTKPEAFAWNDDPNDVTGFYDRNEMDQYIEALESKWKYWRQSRSDLLDHCKELEARLASAEELLEVPSRKMVYLCRDYKDDENPATGWSTWQRLLPWNPIRTLQNDSVMTA